MKNKRVLLVALGILLNSSLRGFCDSSEVIIYRENHLPLRGTLKSITDDAKVEIENNSGRSSLSLSSKILLIAERDWSTFSEILRASNFKQLSRKRFILPDLEIPWEAAAEEPLLGLWQSLSPLFEPKENAEARFILGFRIYPSGSVSNIIVMKAVRQTSELEASVIQNLSKLTLPPLPKNYTGPWIPFYIVIDKPRIERALILYQLKEELRQKIASSSKEINPCQFRLELIISSEGRLVQTEAFGSSKKAYSNYVACTRADIKKLTEAVTSFNYQQIATVAAQDLNGLSVRFSPRADQAFHIQTLLDPSVVDEALQKVLHQYQRQGMIKAVDKEILKLAKAENFRFTNRHSRYARYLVTFSQSQWPHLKQSVLTTPSGDPKFDAFCTQALKQVKLPPYPPLMRVGEPTATFKCEYWGRD